MKIILDDTRNLPKSGYNCCRSYDDCIALIDILRNDIDFISLDYSLAEENTGYDVLVYMKENNISPNHINIHSDHELGVPKMKKYAEYNFKNSIITINPLGK